MPPTTSDATVTVLHQTKSKVLLIPWDPESSEHTKRLYDQRVACGWKYEMIEMWRGLQREGKMGLHWVVLSPDDPTLSTKLTEHTTRWLSESTPISDTAASLCNIPRNPPSTPSSFTPIGHISLDAGYPNSDLANGSVGLYCLSTLYISTALQGRGLGSAAMDAVEDLASREPVCAKMLALNTMAREEAMDVVRLNALGKRIPKVCNQDWYERRGYEVFKRVEDVWREMDRTGKEWRMKDVYMRKSVGV